MEKQEKIDVFAREAMKLAPNFRKNFTTPPVSLKTKLSPHQFFCLMHIYKHGPISMGDLAIKLGVSNQQLTRIMDGLVKQKMVERFQFQTNRRMIQTRISEEGKAALREIHLSIQENTRQALQVLSEEELDQCIFHIRALATILAKAELIQP